MNNAEAKARLKWTKFKVLDDGFVSLVDVMGDDTAIVQAARVSYGEGTKHVNNDRNLIRYLMRHRHSTPFEMAEIKLAVRVPMDCWRQWVRHRTANINEYSTRYSHAINSAAVTAPDAWRTQSNSNNQGSEGTLDSNIGKQLSQGESDLQIHAREVYEERLAHGVAREQARKDLPLSTYTEAYWKVDLNNLLHFLWLRMDNHAQWEIRQYAQCIGYNIIKPLFPLAWEAFEDYKLLGMHLSNIEVNVISNYITNGGSAEQAVDFIENNREKAEALDKLRRIICLDRPATNNS